MSTRVLTGDIEMSVFDDCPICMCEISKKRNNIALLCGHKFCATCILQNVVQALSDKCPLCRVQFTSNENVCNIVRPHNNNTEYIAIRNSSMVTIDLDSEISHFESLVSIAMNSEISQFESIACDISRY
jgi:hypothetical protein